ncbi:MAG TPA: TlpA disulfide reductase family protein [Candidatus Sulfotelmatobacter sp.]|nr:TlpA disulfide reductase family protein [Candidatus Sulfotelmatobacter sp.]
MTFLVSALLAMSVFLNVFLARKVAFLRVQNKVLVDSDQLQVGSPVPPLTGSSPSGTPMSVRFGDVRIPTVLYIFSPQCGWCAKNIENFRSLISQAGTGYRVVGLSTTRQDLDDYLSRERLILPVFASLDSVLIAAYHVNSTPTTIVISPDGKVLRVWTGAYQDGLRHEVEAFLGVHLLPCCDGGAPELKTKS